MTIDSLKLDTITALQEADKAGQRLLGAGTARALFLNNMLTFTDTFGLSPVTIITGQIENEKHYVLYAQVLKVLIENIAILYGLTKEEVMAVMDKTAAEQLESFRQQVKTI